MSRIDVSRLPVDPGPAAWNELLPDAAPAQSVEGKQTADWIIIGAGFAGLAAARRLSQLCPTDRIVILEARRVAEGPAGRNSGFMIDLPHDLSSSDYGGAREKDHLLTADNRHAIAFASEMADDFGLGEEIFSKCGKINGAATAKGVAHNREYAAHLASIGEPSDMLDAQSMKELTGADYYLGGLYTAGTAIIQPAAFVRGVAKGLSSDRVKIFENSPVTGLQRCGDWTATTDAGKVTAPKVILAVNGHLDSFGFFKNQLMHVFTYASMTRPLAHEEMARLGGKRIWGITPADPMGTTVRRISSQDGDRIVVRNRFTFDPSMEDRPPHRTRRKGPRSRLHCPLSNACWRRHAIPLGRASLPQPQQRFCCPRSGSGSIRCVLSERAGNHAGYIGWNARGRAGYEH